MTFLRLRSSTKYIAILILLCLACGYVFWDISRIYYARSLLNDVPSQYVVGQQTANVTVVEFLDYGCPFCREIHPTITDAISQTKDIQYIPRPLPLIDGQAARLVYAAAEQNAFLDVHNYLMDNYRPIDEYFIQEVADTFGMDYQKLKTDMYIGSVEDKIRENITLFQRYNGTATPFFIIKTDMYYVPEVRMPKVQDFLDMFDDARQVQ